MTVEDLLRALLEAAPPGELEDCLRQIVGAPTTRRAAAKPVPAFSVQCQSFGGILALPAVTLDGPKGTQTTAMLLDTGASDVTINPTLAQTLGLQPQQQTETSTAAGPEAAWLTTARVTVAGVTAVVKVLVDPGLTDVPPLLGISWWRIAGLIPALDASTFLLRAYQPSAL
jgi:predicted aspartyl protease